VRHLDPVRLEGNDPFSPYLRHYREDLLAIAEEILAEIGNPQPPAECQPLARVVSALMRSEPLARTPRLSTEMPWGVGEVGGIGGFDDFGGMGGIGGIGGIPGIGDVAPSPEDEATLLSGMWSALEQREPAGLAASELANRGAMGEAGEIPCSGCWARHLCSHSALPSSPVNASADHRDPDEARCAFWRTEVEVGLRFYHRLAHADPIQALRLFSGSEVPVDPFDRSHELGQPKLPF
jgi:hypothetical protein